MPLLAEICFYIFIGLLILVGGFFAVVGWIGKAESYLKKFPWMERQLARKRSLEVLLIGAIIFLVGDGLLLVKVKLPEAKPPVFIAKAPLAPILPEPVGQTIKPAPQIKNSISGTTTVAPCSAIQQGQKNEANINCGPPPLELAIASVTPGPPDPNRPGITTTIYRIVPNQPVSAPYEFHMDFNKRIVDMSFWIEGGGPVQGGGPFSNSEHAFIGIASPFTPSHALLITVYSNGPVEVIGKPYIK